VGQRHGVGISKVQAAQGFGHHHRVLPVRGEIQVVGVVDRTGVPGLPVAGSMGVRLLLKSLVTQRVFRS